MAGTGAAAGTPAGTGTAPVADSVWLSLLLLVLVPVFLLTDLFRARHATRGDWVLAAGCTAAYLLFVTLVGRWDFFTTWLPYLYFLLLPVVLYLPSRRPAPSGEPSELANRAASRLGNAPQGKAPSDSMGPGTGPPGPTHVSGLERARASLPFRAFLGLALIALLTGSWLVYSGRSWSEEIPSFVFPLADGTWYIGEGGDHALLNAHHGDPAQAFALHIVKLNAWGGSATGIRPGDIDRYEIFGETVYSPCTGEVLHAVSGRSDRAPSAGRPEHGGTPDDAGNHIVLECEGREGLKVVLAHLQEASVLVSMGDLVRIEDPLGRVGNSGSSPEPHLHIHVEQGGSPAAILDGEAVQVQYEGRYLVRGQVVRSGPRAVRTAVSHPRHSWVYRP